MRSAGSLARTTFDGERARAVEEIDLHRQHVDQMRQGQPDGADLLPPGCQAVENAARDHEVAHARLAQRLLGNRLKSHQLARYNGIEGQASLSTGQMLRIPGETPRAEPVKRPERSADPQGAPTRPKSTPAPRTAATSAAAGSGANPAAARQARSAGLAALNDGHPGRAVALLSRAAALDPGNAAIGRDLKRAKQINATVQARQ